MPSGSPIIAPLAPDEAAGKALVNAAILKVDPDELKKLALTIHNTAVVVTRHRLPVIEARAAATGAIAAFKGEWQPDSKYDAAVAAWESNAECYSSTLDETTQDMNTTANALMWIADNFSEAERVNADKMKQVSTDFGADGGAGGPVPSSPKAPPTPPAAEPPAGGSSGPKISYA